MKQLIAILLTAILLICPGVAENSGVSATLRFSSFAGGGYEYTVVVGDPEIAGVETRYLYEEQDEPIDGAAFDFVVDFTGLKPGSTRAVVFGRSPNLENDDRVYTVDVDDALNVTLTPVRTLCRFSLALLVEGGYTSYRITLEKDGYVVSVDEGPERPFSAGAVDELMAAMEKYDIACWDGFDGVEPDVLDGECFWLDIAFTDGARVSASGENAFPENYSDAMNMLWRILTWETEE